MSSFGGHVASGGPTPVPLSRAILLGAAVIIGVGVLLRLLGQLTIEVWADEALWANKLLEGNVGWIRPPAYMAATKLLLAVRNDEVMLRSLSLLPSLVQLPLLFLLLRRIVVPWAALVGVFLLAVHPTVVAMAKEFKPYALEASVHTALIAMALAYVQAPRTRLLVALVVVAAVAPPFAWSPVFIYPGVFLAVGFSAWQAGRRTDVMVAVGGVVATLLVLGGVFMARLKNADPHPEFWGTSYNVFYLGSSVGDRLAWIADQTDALMSWPLRLKWLIGVVEPLKVVSTGLVCTGILALVLGRRWSLVLLLVLPWGVMLAFNQAGQWPWGVFRTNVFVLSWAIPLLVIGLEAIRGLLARRHRAASTALAVVAVVGLAGAAPINLDAFRHKGSGTFTADAAVLQGLRVLKATVGTPTKKVVVAFDGQGCTIMRYYRDHHDAVSAELGPWLRDHVDARCSVGRDAGYQRMLAEEIIPRTESTWFLVAKPANGLTTDTVVRPTCTASLRKRLRGSTIFWCGKGDDTRPTLARPVRPGG
jgi:hypothetical protein